MTGLHHVAIGAYDIEAMARFYRAYFHLKESDRQLDEKGECRSIWLAAGPITLMIEQLESPPSQVPMMRQGAFLLAFPIEARERDAARERLTSTGISIESESTWSMYFRDPEGNRVALTHYPNEVRSSK